MSGSERQRPAALIFDMDGLMLDTEPLYKAAWQQAASELGYSIPNAEYHRFVGLPTAACDQLLLDLLGEDFPLSTFRRRWPDLWRASLTSGVSAKPGLDELLSLAVEHNLPVAIATSTRADDAALTLRSAGFDKRFAAVVTIDDVTHGKPAPDIYVEAARRLNVAPGDCVALEDSGPGVLAARSAGMTPILIPDYQPPSAEARRAAFCVLGSLHEARELIAGWLEGAR